MITKCIDCGGPTYGNSLLCFAHYEEWQRTKSRWKPSKSYYKKRLRVPRPPKLPGLPRPKLPSIRVRAINKLGGVCIRCSFSDIRALQIDHINGDGTIERKSLSPCKLYKLALNNPTKYQVLCANCNWIKRVENKENKKQV